MFTIILTIFSYTLALALFCQALVSGIRLSIKRIPLTPPAAPPALLKAAAKSKSTPNVSELPELQGIRPTTTTKCYKDFFTSACNGNECSSYQNNPMYVRTVPYLSYWLLTVQATLGVVVTMSLVVMYLLEVHGGCLAVARISTVGFFVGISILFLASAVQTHIVNDMCIKIFFIMLVGFAAQFTMLGFILPSTLSASIDERTGLCLFDIQQPSAQWFKNLPMYAAIAHFVLSFFSSISIINGAFRLCPHTRFLSPRAIFHTLTVYRGLGLLFANGVTGIGTSICVIVVACFGHFHFSPYWILQWSVMSRIVSVALWHRAVTDPAAPEHRVWKERAKVVEEGLRAGRSAGLPSPVGSTVTAVQRPDTVVGNLMCVQGGFEGRPSGNGTMVEGSRGSQFVPLSTTRAIYSPGARNHV